MYELKLGEVYPTREEGSSPVRIFAEDEFDPYWCSCARKPYFRLRGKPVSPTDAVNIIARTDEFFNGRFFSKDLRFKGCVSSGLFTMNFFGYAGCEKTGWVHPCGAIGLNDLFGYKWAEIREIASSMLDLADNFPYLDFIAAVSWWDEMSPKRWRLLEEYVQKFVENGEKSNDESKYYDDEDFTENIDMGIWVHNGTIEFINSELAAELYEEYDKLYDNIDRRMFFPGYYDEFAPDVINRDLWRKCLNVYGIGDADGFAEEVGFKQLY